MCTWGIAMCRSAGADGVDRLMGGAGGHVEGEEMHWDASYCLIRVGQQ